MPEDAAMGRKLSFSWPEQRQELKALLSDTYCSLVEAPLPAPTACSGGSSSRQVGSGCEPGDFGSQGQLGYGRWETGWSVQELGLLSCVGWCCALTSPHAIAQSLLLTVLPWLLCGTMCGVPGPIYWEGNKGKYSCNPSINIHMGCQSGLALA